MTAVTCAACTISDQHPTLTPLSPYLSHHKVGVGGSGKQSLSRLAAFICGFTVMQIVISSTYGINDLKDDLKAMCTKAGTKEEGVMFILTDSQITNERFLVYINDLLASGNIPDLFAPDEVPHPHTAPLTVHYCIVYCCSRITPNSTVLLSYSSLCNVFKCSIILKRCTMSKNTPLAPVASYLTSPSFLSLSVSPSGRHHHKPDDQQGESTGQSSGQGCLLGLLHKRNQVSLYLSI